MVLAFLRLLLAALTVNLDYVQAQGLGGIWPIPQPTFKSGNTPLFISPDIEVFYHGASLQKPKYDESSFSSSAIVRFGVSRALKSIFEENFVPWMLLPRHQLSRHEPSRHGSDMVHCLHITLSGSHATCEPSPTNVDESYNLTIAKDGTAKLSACSANGLLHGLETFSQLFYQHSSGNAFYLVNAPIEIEDAPVHPWRGIMLDTARNWLPVDAIIRTIDGLAYSKLNKLHVHVTDSQSWPLVIPSMPALSAKGAYSPLQVYTPDDILRIQTHGRLRGVEVYFEIDMPGHIGVVSEAYPDLVVAVDARPYTKYCAEPPCGAFKLNDTGVEKFLGKLFDDVLPRVAPYTSYWHTGGDELKAEDYTLDPALKTNSSAVLQPLLQDFIDKQHTRVRKAGLRPIVWEEIPSEWNVTLGPDVVVQSWLGGTAVQDLAAKGFQVLDSNYNFYYLDCGRGDWVTWGPDAIAKEAPFGFTDWCSPAKNWELIYSHDPSYGLQATNNTAAKNILGGELALWSETIDSQNLDSFAWPRAAAAAEIFWSGFLDAHGQNRSQLDAAPRLNNLRQRLVARGIGASPIQMTWCTMYPNATGCAQPSS